MLLVGSEFLRNLFELRLQDSLLWRIVIAESEGYRLITLCSVSGNDISFLTVLRFRRFRKFVKTLCYLLVGLWL